MLDRLLNSAYAHRVKLHFDDGNDTQHFHLPEALARPHTNGHVCVCGPVGFIEAVLSQARQLGWGDSRLHHELFAGPSVDSDGQQVFQIKIASSGQDITVERDQTALQALEQSGIVIPTSCEQGICGTCLTRVLEGIPDHRDLFLSDAEHAANDQFLPCCSRAISRRLVLDL